MPQKTATQPTEALYQVLVESAPVGMLIVQDGIITFTNNMGANLAGFAGIAELIGTPIFSLIPEKQREAILQRWENSVPNKANDPIEIRYIDKKNRERVVETISMQIPVENETAMLIIARDMTYHRNIEQIIREQKDMLEEKNAILKQKHAALQELMAQLVQEDTRNKDHIKANISTIILPLLDKLRSSAAKQQEPTIDILEKSILSMTDSFGAQAARKMQKLSPKELEICVMIRHGLTTKEIARSMSCSIKTIETYRKRVRQKLGLKNKSTNLGTYLKNAKM